MRALIVAVLAACGSSSTPTTPTTPPSASGPTQQEIAASQEKKRELARRAVITAEHRKLESEQQDFLGATCTDNEKWAQQQCAPSCYPPEQPDPRMGTKVTGAIEIQHMVCQQVLGGDSYGPFAVMDELAPKLAAKKFRKRFPKPHGKKAWQAEVTNWLAESLPKNKLPKGDVMIVVDKWHAEQHPITLAKYRCVTVSHFTRSLSGKLDACAATRGTVCEATGNDAVRGINLMSFRIAEAKRFKAKGNETGCKEAALAVIATARGMPRWRQYAKLNVGAWKDGIAYKTRFEGVLDEEQLFERAAAIGSEAEQLYSACGGEAPATTTAQEQAFHSCP